MSDLADRVKENGIDPKKVQVAGESVETHNPDQQIKLDQHVDANEGIKRAHRGLFFTQLVGPPSG